MGPASQADPSHPFQRQNSEPVFMPFKNNGGRGGAQVGDRFDHARFQPPLIKQEPVDYGYEAGML